MCAEDDIVNVIRKYTKSINSEKVLQDSYDFKISNRMICELSQILTRENGQVTNLHVIYDIPTSKKKWAYDAGKLETRHAHLLSSK